MLKKYLEILIEIIAIGYNITYIKNSGMENVLKKDLD
jgi:hypothetical protein